jgi:hypothetical protein
VRTGIALAAMTLALLALTLPLFGQDAGPREVRGRVLDAVTGDPLSSVWVEEAEAGRGTLTRKDGTFLLPRFPAGGGWLTFDQLGYLDGRIWVGTDAEEGVAEGETYFVEFLLEPDAILLEGLSVTVDRLTRRRRAVATSVRAFDRDDLAFSPFFTALEHIEARVGFRTMPCRTRSIGFADCAYIRGRSEPVSVWVDEAPVLGGLTYLDVIQPHEIHTLEVYGRGRHIRVYTHQFMERLAKNPRTLMPITVGLMR